MASEPQTSVRRRGQSQGGFTLLELLLVLAIIGLMLGLFGMSFVLSLRSADVRDAAAELATELRRARSVAQRGSRDVVITWLPGPDGDFTSYRVGTQDHILPETVVMRCVAGCHSTEHRLTYTAPYGELSRLSGAIQGKAFTFRSRAAGVSPLSVRAVGVTGKVIVSRGEP